MGRLPSPALQCRRSRTGHSRSECWARSHLRTLSERGGVVAIGSDFRGGVETGLGRNPIRTVHQSGRWAISRIRSSTGCLAFRGGCSHPASHRTTRSMAGSRHGAIQACSGGHAPSALCRIVNGPDAKPALPPRCSGISGPRKLAGGATTKSAGR